MSDSPAGVEDPLLPADPPPPPPLPPPPDPDAISSQVVPPPPPDSEAIGRHLRNRILPDDPPQPSSSHGGGRKPKPAHITKASATHVLLDLSFTEIDGFSFKPPVKNFLPLCQQIISRFCHLSSHWEGNFSLNAAVGIITSELTAVWKKANIPTIAKKNIRDKVERLVGVYKKLSSYKNTEKVKQKWFVDSYAKLTKDMPDVFDIKASDSYILAHSKELPVPYGDMEQAFYLDQISKAFTMGIGGVDKRWMQEDEDRRAAQQRTEAKRRRLEERRALEQIKSGTGCASTDDIDAAIGMDTSQVTCADESVDDNDDDVVAADFERYIMTRSRKRRLDECGEVQMAKDLNLRVRKSYHKIYNRVYDFLIKFMSVASASNRQAILAAKFFVDCMFGVKWLTQEEANHEKKKIEDEGKKIPPDFYHNVLPSDTALDRMRDQYARATQRGIGELILGLEEDQAVTQHGDSTTRSMTGKIFTSPLSIGKNCHFSLPIQKLNFETKEDVAQVYATQYEMFSALTGQPASAFFDRMTSFMHDSATEMEQFMSVLQTKVSSNHKPYQLKCVMHTCLGFTETEIKVVSALEQTIGPDKLYQSANCHDKTNVSKSVVNAVLKLISPQFQQKPYNLKAEFDILLSESGDGQKNDAFPLRSHRFGALERASAVVLYHWDQILILCEKVENRNDLIIYVRTTMDCSFVKHIILCFALIGLFLIEPFCELVTTSDHLDLCRLFPSLFSDLKKPKDVANGILRFSSDAIPTLKPYFDKVVEKQVYPNRWLKSLQDEIETLDDDGLETVRNVLALFSFHCGDTLQRQRGREYGFGISSDSAAGKLWQYFFIPVFLSFIVYSHLYFFFCLSFFLCVCCHIYFFQSVLPSLILCLCFFFISFFLSFISSCLFFILSIFLSFILAHACI